MGKSPFFFGLRLAQRFLSDGLDTNPQFPKVEKKGRTVGNWVRLMTVIFKEAKSRLEVEGDAAKHTTATPCPWRVLPRGRMGSVCALGGSSGSCHYRTSQSTSWDCSQCQGTGINCSLGVYLTSMSLTRSACFPSPAEGHPAKISGALGFSIDCRGLCMLG